MENNNQIPTVLSLLRKGWGDCMLKELQDLANTLRQEVHTELNPEGAGSREEEGKAG